MRKETKQSMGSSIPQAKAIKKTHRPLRTLPMSLPDQDTVTFWKMTADSPHEWAVRIAKFSRRISNDGVKNATQCSRYRRRGHGLSVRAPRVKPLGKLLVMPSRSEIGIKTCSQKSAGKAAPSNGGNNESTGHSSKEGGYETSSRSGAASHDVSKTKNKENTRRSRKRT
jgi:hypothetical protein